MRRLLAALALLILVACADAGPGQQRSTPTVAQPSTSTSVASSAAGNGVVVIPYRLERRTTDAATGDFQLVVETTLLDPRGWSRAGFRFEHRPDAPYRIVLAEGPEIDVLCLPYDTFTEFSCQNGATVALNADRWRTAHSKWTGDVATYRQMLVNHEVGHLIGMHHPQVQCPEPGRPAPIMAQQSTELEGCLPNPWPLDSEIERAARHDLKIAPEFGE